jgi:selenide,water dikinase
MRGGIDALLLGGGHAHAMALRHLARHPCPALRLTLVTPARHSLYSGMLPGVIRGDYRPEQARIDCARVAARAGARLMLGEAVSLDLAGRRVWLADGRSIGFDLLSLDVGGRSEPAPGSIPVRPIGDLLTRAAALDAGDGAVAVVGGGPAGVELALALAQRWPGRALTLLTRRTPLADAPPSVQGRALAALQRHGIVVRTHADAVGCAPDGVVLANGDMVPAKAALWATGAVGPALLSGGGLALDGRGCVRTDASLRSVSHPFVLAAGDCAASEAFTRPKAGVWAVRAGRPLAETLCALAERREPATWCPQRSAWTMLGVGDGHALSWRGHAWLAGRAAWWWKDALDREWVRRFA